MRVCDQNGNCFPQDLCLAAAAATEAALEREGICQSYLDEASVGDQLLRINHVHQRLFDCHIFDAGHIEAVHVLPPCSKRHGFVGGEQDLNATILLTTFIILPFYPVRATNYPHHSLQNVHSTGGGGESRENSQ